MTREAESQAFPTKDVQQRIVAALIQLYRYEKDLLDADTNERSITHKLAEYLQIEFPRWHVDCEYNRRGFDTKKLFGLFNGSDVDDTEASTVYPDIIVHRRGAAENLLVVEVKKTKGKKDTKDREKLEEFGTDENYMYQYGLFLRLGTCGCSDIEFYIRGKGKPGESAHLKRLIQDGLASLGYAE